MTLPREVLDPLVAPKLPLLLLAGYPHLMRQALVQVHTRVSNPRFEGGVAGLTAAPPWRARLWHPVAPSSQVRSASEKRAMLVLNNYVIGVYEEMGDALEQMQWRSLATLRDLCDAAMEGGAPTPLRDATRHNLHAEAAPFAAQERSG